MSPIIWPWIPGWGAWGGGNWPHLKVRRVAVDDGARLNRDNIWRTCGWSWLHRDSRPWAIAIVSTFI